MIRDYAVDLVNDLSPCDQLEFAQAFIAKLEPALREMLYDVLPHITPDKDSVIKALNKLPETEQKEILNELRKKLYAA